LINGGLELRLVVGEVERHFDSIGRIGVRPDEVLISALVVELVVPLHVRAIGVGDRDVVEVLDRAEHRPFSKTGLGERTQPDVCGTCEHYCIEMLGGSACVGCNDPAGAPLDSLNRAIEMEDTAPCPLRHFDHLLVDLREPVECKHRRALGEQAVRIEVEETQLLVSEHA